MRKAAFILGVALSFSLGCKSKDIPNSVKQTENAEAVGEHIANLLSTKCDEGYYFAEAGGRPAYQSPGRKVSMKADRTEGDGDKFLGIQWRGNLLIMPTGGTNSGWGASWSIFERADRWYLQPSGQPPVPVDELQSVAPECPKT